MFDFMKLFRRGDESELPPPPDMPRDDDDSISQDGELIDDATASGARSAALLGSASGSIDAARDRFAKPEYNRQMFNATSGVSPAIREVKSSAFGGDQRPLDPYTGHDLVLTQGEAKAMYGGDWQSHAAEADHRDPAEQIYKRHGSDAFATKQDLDAVANSPDNLEVISRKVNNAKRSDTNREFVESGKARGAGVTDEGAERAIARGDEAQKLNDGKLQVRAAQNALETFHTAGVQGAQDVGAAAAVISTINNIRDVASGKKSAADAIKDVGKDTAKGAATGYLMGGGLTTLTQSLSSSSSPIIQSLVKSNVPAKVVTAVMMTGSTLKDFADGKITTEECLLRLGESGASFAAYGYGAAAGQMLVPIPIVGAVIGGMIASAMVSSYGSSIRDALEQRKKQHEQSVALVNEYERIIDEERAYRAELEEYIQGYFREHRGHFAAALSDIRAAYAAGDADGMIAGANKITRKLGGKVYFDTVDEFKDFLDSDEAYVI